MTDTAKKRLAIDLDEIERQLRQSAPQHSAPQHHSPKNDPLAELARIVGQDDPFRAILSADRAGVEPRRSSPEADDIFGLGPDPRAQAPHHAPRHEPHFGEAHHEAPHAQPHSFDEFLDEADQPRYAQPQSQPHQDDYADDIYAAPAHAAHAAQSVSPQAHPHYQDEQQQEWREHDAYADHSQYDELYDDTAYRDMEHPRTRETRGSRKGLLTVGAVLGVAVLGVASALIFSGGGSGTPDGEPVLITAGSEPLKVAPQNPGGVEIPNQNRQIYGGTGDEETQIVDREEQPVDIGEVAREAPRVILPPPASLQDREQNDPISQVLAGLQPSNELQAPSAVSSAVAALGEPRRVRTVSVRPDGTIIGNEPTQQVAQAEPSEPRTISDLVPVQPFQQTTPVPSAVPDVAADPTPPTPVAQSPAQPPAQAPAPAPVQQAQPVQLQPAAPLALTGAPPTAPQRESAEGPTQVASLPDPAPPAAAPAPAPTGGYAVQLAIRETEERAYQAFSQYQARYAGIIDNADPIVRRAELNGNTIYRIRVGPYALADANAVCERIKGTGGDCFVARN